MPTRSSHPRKSALKGRAGGILLLASLWGLASCALVPGYTPRSVLAAENLAVAEGYAELSNYPKAQEYYRKAARSKDYRNAAEWGLARSLALSGDFTSALPLLEGLLKRDSQNRMLLEARAYALVALERTEDGLAAYGELRESYPDDPEAAVDYVAALTLAKRWDDALGLATQVRERFPDAEALSRLERLEETALAGKEKDTAEETQGESPEGSLGDNPEDTQTESPEESGPVPSVETP